jgi:hypothetical protein
VDRISFGVYQVLGEGHVSHSQRLLERIGAKPVDMHQNEVAAH